jgi:alcohol dehydrogenase class IV
VSGISAWRFPSHLEIGPGSLTRLGELLRSQGQGRAFVVSDPGVAGAGILAAAQASLEAAGIESVPFTEVPGEPTLDAVADATRALRECGAGRVVGVGGGSVLDVAKATAALATNGGSVSDYWGVDLYREPALPLALVPTTAGTGSEVSQFAVFTDPRDRVKKVTGGAALMAEVAVVDAELTLSVPPRVTADAGMDALTHAVEAYLAAAPSAFSDAVALKAVELIAGSLVTAYREPEDREARTAMMEASTLAGMAFNAAGLGAVHALAYPLDTHYEVPHGRTNAVLLAPVLRFYGSAAGRRLAALGAAVGTDDFPTWVEDLLAALHIPRRLRDYGVPDAEAARRLGREGWETGQRLLANVPRKVTRADAEEVYASRW